MAPKHILSSKRPSTVPKLIASASFAKSNHFPFLELPQEIQDMIGTYYYGSYSLIIRPRIGKRPDNGPPHSACQQGLELVSKHVNRIATPIRKAAFDGQITIYWSRLSKLDRLLWLSQCEDVEWLLQRTVRLNLEGVECSADGRYLTRIIWPFIAGTFPGLERTTVVCATITVPSRFRQSHTELYQEYVRAFKDEGVRQVPGFQFLRRK